MHTYELVLADVYARTRRRAGDAVQFLGGTDDYSLKNVLAAKAAGVPTPQFVDEHGARFQALAEPLNLSFDDFIRTSVDERHAPAVERLWRACAANGDLYTRAYEGDYCVGCEQFYTGADLVGGLCPEHGTRTEQVAEENWFRLPPTRTTSSGSSARVNWPYSPSRSAKRSWAGFAATSRTSACPDQWPGPRGWGIGVPDHPSQVIYVWFDALTNYISALGFAIRRATSTADGGWSRTGGCTSSARASCASTPCTGPPSSPRPASPRRVESRSTLT